MRSEILGAILDLAEPDEDGYVSDESAEQMMTLAEMAEDGGEDEGEPQDLSTVRMGADIAGPLGEDLLQQAQSAHAAFSEVARMELREALTYGTVEERISRATQVLERHQPILVDLLAQSELAAKLQAMDGLAIALPSIPIDVPPFATMLAGEGFGDIRLPLIENAAESLAARQVLDAESFRDLAAQARRTAFTVAGIEEQSTLEKIRDALTETVEEGASLRGFSDRLESVVEDGSSLSPQHMETVYRTNVQSALAEGQKQILENPLVASAFPYVRYNAVHDSRARPDHLAMEKRGIQGTNIYRADDPVIDQFRPPWDFNCRCNLTAITLRQAARAGIREAQQWLETGLPPIDPDYVATPPFIASAGWGQGPVSLSLFRLGWVRDTRVNPRSGKPYSENRYINEESGKIGYFKKPPGQRKKKQPAEQPAKQRQQPAAPSLPPARQLTDGQQRQLDRIADKTRKDVSDPSHVLNRRKDQFSEASFGGSAKIRTLRSTQDNPLDARDHTQMAESHSKAAEIFKIRGNSDLEQAHRAAGRYHSGLSQKKSASPQRDETLYDPATGQPAQRGQQAPPQQQEEQLFRPGESEPVQRGQPQQQEEQLFRPGESEPVQRGGQQAPANPPPPSSPPPPPNIDYSPDIPPDQIVTQKQFVDKQRDALNQASHLPDELKKYYGDSLQYATRKMNDKASSRMAMGAKKLNFFAQHSDYGQEVVKWQVEKMTSQNAALFGSGDLQPEQIAELMGTMERYSSGAVMGSFNSDTGDLLLDGASSNDEGGMEVGIAGPQGRNAHHTYTHELAHAIDFADGKGRPLSSHPEWFDAWKEEIQAKRPTTTGEEMHALSAYSATSHEEGFAEFGRLIWAMDVPPEKIQKHFPKCYQYMQKQGMVS